MKGFKKRTEKHLRSTSGFEKQNQKDLRPRGMCRETKHATKNTGGQENGLEKHKENIRDQGGERVGKQKERQQKYLPCGARTG